MDGSRRGGGQPPEILDAAEADEHARTWACGGAPQRVEPLAQRIRRAVRCRRGTASVTQLLDAANDALETPVIDAHQREPERAQSGLEIGLLRQRDDEIRMQRDEGFVARGEVSTDLGQ